MSNATLRLDFGGVPEPDELAGDDAAAVIPLIIDIPFTWSEAHRHECEVRLLVAKGRAWSVEYCRGIKEKRGRTPEDRRAAAERLWLDARKEAKRTGAWLNKP
jgi:hypothetical protein